MSVAAGVGNFVKFTWDAENRLIEVEPPPRSETSATIPAGYRRLKFAYDYRGRRVEKLVYKRDASNNANWGSNPIERRRFVWNGWLMLRETIETDANADGDFVDTGDSTRTKTYAWGRDLSGSLESAGGIGGLLSVYDDNATTTGGSPTADDLAYIYCYDANGNVGQVCNLSATTVSASLVAKYEYDAFGNVSASSGTYATANTYRFSTKPWDDETGLGYWGYRYYEPRLGRWLNRDPLEELGGIALYAYCGNMPVAAADPMGLWFIVRYPFPRLGGQDSRPTSNPASGPTSTPASGPASAPTPETDGCSVPEEYRDKIPDKDNPGGFPFLSCCNAHDICYGTPSKHKKECDDAFLECMQNVCESIPKEEDKDGEKHDECMKWAGIYHSAVYSAGWEAYCKAQASAGNYPKECHKIVQPPTKPPKPTTSSPVSQPCTPASRPK